MNRIRELREHRDMDQKALAAQIGVSQPTVSDWETGRKVPSSKSAARLADFFGVSIDWLLGRTIEQPEGEEDVWALRERLRRQPELRLLFSATEKATKEDLLKTVRILEALKDNGAI